MFESYYQQLSDMTSKNPTRDMTADEKIAAARVGMTVEGYIEFQNHGWRFRRELEPFEAYRFPSSKLLEKFMSMYDIRPDDPSPEQIVKDIIDAQA